MGWPLLATAVALTANLASAGAQAPPADELPATEILDMEHERHRRMTVPVTIGGQGPFQFMIDTGAQATVLSRVLADQLGLFDRRPATLVGMASTRPVETTEISDLGLGSRSFLIQTAPVVEGAYIGGADGILGLDSLQNQRVMIDFAQRQLTVADADSPGADKGFEIVVRARRKLGQLIITSARLDGVKVAVMVDTGAQGSLGNMALLERLRRSQSIAETSLTDVNGVALGGPVKIVQELDLGRVRLNNVPVMFADSPTFHMLGLGSEPALILGMDQLRLFNRVAIDFQTRRVLFDLPHGTDFTDAVRFGRRG
jgi:predicted aspartyl protease